MSPKVAELLAALPDLDLDEESAGHDPLKKAMAELTTRPGRRARASWAFGGLQAQITLAYLAYGSAA